MSIKDDSGGILLPCTFEELQEAVDSHQRETEERFKNSPFRAAYREYERRHRFCPKCGLSDFAETCIGCIMNAELDPLKHYDSNRVKCICGWVGIRHDMIEDGMLPRLKTLAWNVLNAIESTDKLVGAGDRTHEENESLEHLKEFLLEHDEKNK